MESGIQAPTQEQSALVERVARIISRVRGAKPDYARLAAELEPAIPFDAFGIVLLRHDREAVRVTVCTRRADGWVAHYHPGVRGLGGGHDCLGPALCGKRRRDRYWLMAAGPRPAGRRHLDRHRLPRGRHDPAPRQCRSWHHHRRQSVVCNGAGAGVRKRAIRFGAARYSAGIADAGGSKTIR